jgi:hypothetical protein
MKNIFKFMGIALMACTLTIACGDKDNEEEGGQGGGGQQPAPEAYAATINGTSLDIAGYHEGEYMAQDDVYTWLFQAAKRAEGNSVYFPYLVVWMEGTNDMDFTNTELYNETYYESDGAQYGDWQFYDNNTCNVTSIDLTEGIVSLNATVTMYYLTDMVESGATQEECTKGTLGITFTNVAFELYQPQQ